MQDLLFLIRLIMFAIMKFIYLNFNLSFKYDIGFIKCMIEVSGQYISKEILESFLREIYFVVSNLLALLIIKPFIVLLSEKKHNCLNICLFTYFYITNFRN